MKFAYFGYDFFDGVLSGILAEGHELVELFSWPTDNEYDFNDKVIQLATREKARITLSPVATDDLYRLRDSGVEVLVSAAYPFKIPEWKDLFKYAVNVHPSPLPEGRGPWPLPWLLLKQASTCAISVHEISQSWDAGDIIQQYWFDLSPAEDLVSLSLKAKLTASSNVPKLINRLPAVWLDKKPQIEGSYWGMPSTADRTIDFSKGVEDIDRIFRAFHRFEPFVFLDGKRHFVRDLSAWKCVHDYEVGTELNLSNRERVFAVLDGLVSLNCIEKAY